MKRYGLMIFDRNPEYSEKCNRYFGAGGYYCGTVGNVSEEIYRKQYEED